MHVSQTVTRSICKPQVNLVENEAPPGHIDIGLRGPGPGQTCQIRPRFGTGL